VTYWGCIYHSSYHNVNLLLFIREQAIHCSASTCLFMVLGIIGSILVLKACMLCPY